MDVAESDVYPPIYCHDFLGKMMINQWIWGTMFSNTPSNQVVQGLAMQLQLLKL